MDFVKKYLRRSHNQEDQLKELAKFIKTRYSYQEGLGEISRQKSKLVVDVDEDFCNLARDIKRLNPKLVEVRTSCRSSRAPSRRNSIDRS